MMLQDYIKIHSPEVDRAESLRNTFVSLLYISHISLFYTEFYRKTVMADFFLNLEQKNRIP